MRAAVERHLEVIAEAARHVSGNARNMFPGIPWTSIIGLRNTIAHEYGEIRHEKVWGICTDRLPALIEESERSVSITPRPARTAECSVTSRDTGVHSATGTPRAARARGEFVQVYRVPGLAPRRKGAAWNNLPPVRHSRKQSAARYAQQAAQARRPALRLSSFSNGGEGPERPYVATWTHWPDWADARTASQTRCVSRASRKLGLAGSPVSRPFRKSASAWMNVCS